MNWKCERERDGVEPDVVKMEMNRKETKETEKNVLRKCDGGER